MREPGWHWRNCRSLGLKLDFWLWPWSLGVYRSEDVFGGERWMHIGPLGLGIAYSIGNSSSEGLERFTGLSAQEAYDRAVRWDGGGTMADLGIPFSPPMVQAIMREIEAPGTGKTQTRRVLTPQPAEWTARVIDITKPTFDPDGGGWGQWETIWRGPLEPGMCEPDREEWRPLKGLRYAVGDRLYVREHWRVSAKHDATAPRDLDPRTMTVFFEAGGSIANQKFEAHEIHTAPWAGGGIPETVWRPDDWPKLGEQPTWVGRFRPGMFMPRWASRITLEVTAVRVERLHDISEADAVAEGVQFQEPTEADLEWGRQYAQETGCSPEMRGVWIAPGTRQGYGATAEERDRPQWGPTAAFAYRLIWNSLHGPEAWASNPWVAVYEFRPQRGNIDMIGGADG